MRIRIQIRIQIQKRIQKQIQIQMRMRIRIRKLNNLPTYYMHISYEYILNTQLNTKSKTKQQLLQQLTLFSMLQERKCYQTKTKNEN